MNSKPRNFVAIDLGASNGRITLGRLFGKKLELEVIHRFEHCPFVANGKTRWDWNLILNDIRQGLYKTGEIMGNETITSISCDAWAQDFGLVNQDGGLFYPPVSYRDPRTNGMPHAFADIIPPTDLINRVGSVMAPITSLCQLRAMAITEPDMLKQAKSLLFIADLVNYNLCGQVATDRTLATASQLCNISTGTWDHNLLKLLDIPSDILPSISENPRVLGTIPKEQAPHPKFAGVPVVISAGHDTAAATVTVPLSQEKIIFLSLGTWAMLGCFTDKPFVPITPDNSCAVVGLPYGKWGLFQGTTGLWIIQECQRIWKQEGHPFTYEKLTAAAQSSSIQSILNLSDPRFAAPQNMLQEIISACTESGQQKPVTTGDFAALVYNSLAHDLKSCIKKLEDLTGRQFSKIHIVGGGSKNPYLCRRLREVFEIPAVVGPSEATTLGNLILQAQVTSAAFSAEQMHEILENVLSSHSFAIP